MKLFRFLTFIALTALACQGAMAQQTKLLTADKHNEYGLIYTLPKTALRIEVTAIRTVEKAGPYYQYAKRYIGTDKVIKNDAEKWTITDVKVIPYGVADDTNRYLMQLKSGSTSFICVSDDGMLMAINKDVPSAPQTRAVMAQEPAEAFSGKEYLQYVNEDFLASQSSAKRAQLLAESLMEVRDSKVSLTRGTAETMPTDGKQLELMLQSLAAQEKALTAAFVGFREETTVKRTYTFLPKSKGKSVLFRMSDFAGFVEADDYSGEPVTVDVDVTRQGVLPTDEKGETKRLPKDAVVYCLPGSATVTVSLMGRKLFSEEMDFAQFGVNFGLNPALFSSKKEPSFAIFDPATGALRELGTIESR